jgi:hypothetical protein
VKLTDGYCIKCDDGILKPVIGKREKALCNTHYWESKRKPIVSKPVQIKRSPLKKNKDYVIPKVTKKQAQRNAQYFKQRGPYLLENPYCVIKVEGCTHIAVEVHHGCGRIGNNLLDESTWVSACSNCHHWVEMNPEAAKELGHSLIRTK